MKRDIDFLKAYERYSPQKNRSAFYVNRMRLMILAGIVFCLIGAGAVLGFLSFQKNVLTSKQQALVQAIKQIDNNPEKQQTMLLEEEYQKLKQYNDLVEAAAEVIQKRPLLKLTDYQTLLRPMSGETLISLAYLNDGTLTATLLCPNSRSIPDYVEALKKTEHFRAVTYNGWQGQEGYMVQIRCTLWEGEDVQ